MRYKLPLLAIALTYFLVSSAASQASPARTFGRVSAGYYFTCGVKTDGTLACWGANPNGETTPAVGTFTQVTTGWYHGCALKADG